VFVLGSFFTLLTAVIFIFRLIFFFFATFLTSIFTWNHEQSISANKVRSQIFLYHKQSISWKQDSIIDLLDCLLVIISLPQIDCSGDDPQPALLVLAPAHHLPVDDSF
jgi:hypothetical protein